MTPGSAPSRAAQVARLAHVELREVEQVHDFVARQAFEREQVTQAPGGVALQVSAGVSFQGVPIQVSRISRAAFASMSSGRMAPRASARTALGAQFVVSGIGRQALVHVVDRQPRAPRELFAESAAGCRRRGVRAVHIIGEPDEQSRRSPLGNARIDGGPVRRSVVGRQHTDSVGRAGQGLADGQADAAAAEIECKDNLTCRRARAGDRGGGWSSSGGVRRGPRRC